VCIDECELKLDVERHSDSTELPNFNYIYEHVNEEMPA